MQLAERIAAILVLSVVFLVALIMIFHMIKMIAHLRPSKSFWQMSLDPLWWLPSHGEVYLTEEGMGHHRQVRKWILTFIIVAQFAFVVLAVLIARSFINE